MKVFIACSSSPNLEKCYYEEMQKVCNMLCDNNYDLCFSPYDKGMLSVCYHTFKNRNRKVSGYTIDAYKISLESMPDVECKIEDSSFDRLKAFYNDCGLFLFMPGGSGTLGEMFGVLEEGKNNLQDKKIVLYNYKNFFDGLLKFIETSKQNGFVLEGDLKNLIIVNNFEELEAICKGK